MKTLWMRRWLGIGPRIGPFGRVAAGLLLIVALLDPQVSGPGGPIHLVLLVDDSDSLPRPTVDAAWRDLGPTLKNLPNGSRLSLLRQGTATATEIAAADPEDVAVRDLISEQAPPRRLPLSGLGTDIAAGIRAGLSLGTDPAGPALRLILISDGKATQGDTADAIRQAQFLAVPVLWHRPDARPASPDTWVEALEAPTQLAWGQSASVRVTLGGESDGDAVGNAQLIGNLTLDLDGEPLLSRSVVIGAGHPTELALPLSPLPTGIHRLTATLKTTGDVQAANDRRSALLEVAGPVRTLVLAYPRQASPVADALTLGGWPVRRSVPGKSLDAELAWAQALILDGLAAWDLPEPDQQAITKAVRDRGLGLIALGGPKTFGSGGYRRATLEGLLPLISEAPRPQPMAAVLFAVDASGSMDQKARAGATHLALARRAVTAASAALQPEDEAGLIAFDAEPLTVLPLARRPAQSDVLGAAWNLIPGGGTRLGPVLKLAVETLSTSDATQRLLILVSDGRFTDAEPAARLQALAEQLAGADVTLIALAVGEDADTEALKTLAAASGGAVLQVADVAELPRLMQAEVTALRAPIERGETKAMGQHPLPFKIDPAGVQGQPEHWPSISAYQVTRGRPEAQVWLAAPNADPLMAAWRAGNGRVLALPGGLGAWAQAWQDWSAWGTLIGGMVQWISAGANPEQAHWTLTQDADRLHLSIDLLGASGEWSSDGPQTVRVRNPAGFLTEIEAKLQGPGRLSVEAPAPLAGRYDLALGDGVDAPRLAVWHQPLDEVIPRNDTDLDQPLAERLVSAFEPGRDNIPPVEMRYSLRNTLVTLALAVFLITLGLERRYEKL